MIDELQPTLENGHFDCPICGKPATGYMLNYERGRQIVTYSHRGTLTKPDKEWKCKVPVLHG